MTVTGDELAAIERQAVEEYPRECCGVILVRGDERRLLRCRNIQDELHAREPDRHPRDAGTAYSIDPHDLLQIARLESAGFAVGVIYHSHIDAGAYFSATDKRQALVGDDPMYPQASYLVVSVMNRRVEAAAAFRWDAGARDFRPVQSGRSLSVTGKESAP